MIMSRAKRTGSFVSDLRIERGFKRQAEIVQAVVGYEIVDGAPVFRSLTVDGVELPIAYAKHSDLLKAYAKHGSVDL